MIIRKETPMNRNTVIFIGSSVCVGTGATQDFGWSAMLARRLESQGWETSSCAIGGQTTADILLRLERDVIIRRPAACIVGLGLANEGLPRARTETEGRIIQGIFQSNLLRIVRALQQAGIRTALGGVYPHNAYGEMHCALLRETDRTMAGWGVPVYRWLDALEDGHGHFKPGLFHDDGHPCDEGYRVMYDCIPDPCL